MTTHRDRLIKIYADLLDSMDETITGVFEAAMTQGNDQLAMKALDSRAQITANRRRLLGDPPTIRPGNT